ncbi:MAG: molybdopterin oxidoreductase family protein, partial [Deltaproteobacteria bacterium]
GDEEDPLSRGYVCPKAVALRDTWEDPNRLRAPLVRNGGGWRECSWDEAIETAAAGIHEVQRHHGKDAVAVYAGNPSVHNLPALLANPPFIRMLGTKVRFSASSADQFPRMLASYLVYGGQFSIPVADVDHTDYFLIIGANPVVSNGSLMTAPGMRRRLRAIRDRGGKVVVVDPRRSETAQVASEHVFLRPGTDALFLLSMLEALFAGGLVDSGAAAQQATGIEELRAVALEFPAERVAPVTGVEAATVRRLAREFTGAPTAACYARIGTCVQPYGTLVNALVDAVNVLAGRLDRRGGMMFTTPASGGVPPGHYGRWRSRVRGIPEFGGEIPVATMIEEMTTPGPGQVRGLVTMAGNPVLSTPNGRRLDEALSGLDFMVSVDPALNETTRHARVILPPRHSLENDQFSLVFQRLSVRNTAKFCPPVFQPEPDELSEWEILGRLATALAALRQA